MNNLLSAHIVLTNSKKSLDIQIESCNALKIAAEKSSHPEYFCLMDVVSKLDDDLARMKQVREDLFAFENTKHESPDVYWSEFNQLIKSVNSRLELSSP